MLSLGNANSSIVWLKDQNNNDYVILIDGGNRGDGQKVIKHLDDYILTPAGKNAPDLIVCTHHDKDHVGGLVDVVNHYGNQIGEIWINNPAEHMGQINYQHLEESFRNKSQAKQYEVILESLTDLDDFISVVGKKQISRYTALAGRNKFNGIISVLGPSDNFYKSLLPGMGNLDDFVNSEADWAYKSIFGSPTVNEALETASPCPIVDEENTTSATNNSSVILEIKRNDSRYLFTGDAGVQAFEDVESRISLENIYWLDVPHHGSRRNLSSKLIDTMSPKVCYISANGSVKHPRRALVNCLRKHGAKVFGTHKGGNKWHHAGTFPDRTDYSTAAEV
jgi:beta-lactamase superfamily II metal-dependent hydrolase